jgi:hypothetical protein
MKGGEDQELIESIGAFRSRSTCSAPASFYFFLLQRQVEETESLRLFIGAIVSSSQATL